MDRRRARALLFLIVVGVAVGAAARVGVDAAPPAPCARPALRDGLVVCDGGGDALGSRAWLFGGKLDLNTADATSLARIRGIGPALANRIVAAREAMGGFDSVDDLDDVDGVGEKMLAKLRDAVDVRPR